MGIPPQPPPRPPQQGCNCLFTFLRDQGLRHHLVRAALDELPDSFRKQFARDVALQIILIKDQVAQIELFDFLDERGLYARLDETQQSVLVGPPSRVTDEVSHEVGRQKALLRQALLMHRDKHEPGDELAEQLWRRVVRNATTALAAQGRAGKKEIA